MDSDGSIYDNSENDFGSEMDDAEVNEENNQMANLSISKELIQEDNVHFSRNDRIEWYKNGIEAMKETVTTLGNQRTEVSKKFNDIRKKYDQTKKTLYGLIETGVAEGAISESDSSKYKDEIKLIDRRALTEMNIDQKSYKGSYKRARNN